MGNNRMGRILSGVLSAALVLSLAPAARGAEPEATAEREATTPNWGDGNVYVTDLDKSGTAASFVGTDGSPYFRIRDLAYIFTGSEHQFNVDWVDGQVVVTTGAAYDGDVLEVPADISAADRNQAPADITVSVDGQEQTVPAIAVDGHYYLTVESFNALLGTDATVQEKPAPAEESPAPQESTAPEAESTE